MDEKRSATGVYKAKRGLPADVIKLVAMALMLVDHIGAVFGGVMDENLYTVLRAAGRISFPLFAFFIIEGFFHTRDVKKYLIRLGAFALISELPFDYAFYWWMPDVLFWGHQNIFFTLALGLLVVWLLDIVRRKITSMEFFPHLAQLLLQVVIVSVGIWLGDLVFVDYNGFGILLVVLFYYCHGGCRAEGEDSSNAGNPGNAKSAASIPGYQRRGVQCVALGGWALLYDAILGRASEIYAVVGMVLFLLYNGEKGKLPLPKWVFYGFYPAHLLVLGLIRQLLL